VFSVRYTASKTPIRVRSGGVVGDIHPCSSHEVDPGQEADPHKGGFCGSLHRPCECSPWPAAPPCPAGLVLVYPSEIHILPLQIRILRLLNPKFFACGAYFSLRNSHKQVLKPQNFPPVADFPACSSTLAPPSEPPPPDLRSSWSLKNKGVIHYFPGCHTLLLIPLINQCAVVIA